MLRLLDISRLRRPSAWVLGVLVAGVMLSLSLFLLVRRWEFHEMRQRCAELTHVQVERLHISILRSMEVLHSVAALHGARGGIDCSEFHEFVQPALARQAELHALSWNPVVKAEQRGSFEASASRGGTDEFQLRELTEGGRLIPAGSRPEYVPVFLIEPLERNAAALGFDLNSDSCRRVSLEQARDTGQPVATVPIRLAQAHGDEAGLLVLLPVYASNATPASVEDRRSSLRGFAVAVFRVPDLVSRAFRELTALGIEARLHDSAEKGELIYESGHGKGGSVAWLEVASRRWALVFSPGASFVSAQSHRQSWMVLFGGLVFTLLATGYLYGGWKRTMEITVANTALQNEVQVRLAAELRADNANQAKSDFLASMSHEIRTPLNAILGYAQLMRRDRHLAPDHCDAVVGIHDSGQHLLGLINEVLDLAKIEAGRMELQPVDFDLSWLARSLTSTFKPLCVQKRIVFRMEFDSAAATGVHGDEGKLRQVLINLLGNAVKFTQAGEVFLRFAPQAGGSWIFEVIDTGLGIPVAEQGTIFQPFHQGSGAAHQGGTGLGLAIAQRQVELLGGKLALQSERGIGSRFYFSIPLGPALTTPSVRLRMAVEPESPPPPPVGTVAVPEALCVRLTVAAELHSTTALKAALQELREHGPEACALAEHMRHKMRSFDLDGVQELIARHVVAHRGETTSPSPHEVCGQNARA